MDGDSWGRDMERALLVVTDQGDIGMNVGGLVITKLLAEVGR